MNYNCPICNKAGLPDYKTNYVICPQCNSDLKVFSLLNSISKRNKSKIGIYLIISASVISIAFAGLLLKAHYDKKELITKNLNLNDRISKIQITKIDKNKKEEVKSIQNKKEASIRYIVKKGDCPYKIAQFFYNDGNKYKQIELDNNLKQPYILKVGQILTIKILQE
ncbi:LysM domain-containing protein [Aestuariibaculum sp. YM273]|uniref:LysM peptidoglycan-binding domain-containing protein n=1 Tax=Aestuariibaculum sp. YM273 TaxID=3070659 RepID=UPI0027DD10C6|nr:LysM domain-containing protein [Aestuariibaculum sp. YM273]WMI64101.1 LysM domain-containing protein [Aestuariibaculum sp. YM273]